VLSIYNANEKSSKSSDAVNIFNIPILRDFFNKKFELDGVQARQFSIREKASKFNEGSCREQYEFGASKLTCKKVLLAARRTWEIEM
jgi:hypothetical protein